MPSAIFVIKQINLSSEHHQEVGILVLRIKSNNCNH